ncbi:MAG TPA: hypothetical protein ENH84_02460 [Phycisphaerae bacterium]|nr:hypothetical protein [Phycisphaerae bacterium]
MHNTTLVFTAMVLLGVATASSADLILSTDSTATLGGLSFSDGDLVGYDPATGIASILLNGDLFSGGEDNIDAAHLMADGHYVLSTTGDSTLGGLSFGKGDLVEYDPIADTATLLFDNTLFSAAEDIDAVYVRDNGNIVMSTVGAAQLGGLLFGDGDLIEYNPTAGTASLLFDENLFSGNEDIEAVHILDDGHILLSTTNNATLGGLSFGKSDVAEYDPVSGTASLYFSGDTFSSINPNINALSSTIVSESGAIVLLSLGGLGLLFRHRFRKIT